MKLLVFGNEDHETDNLAIEVSQKLTPIANIELINIKPNGDLLVGESKSVYILDTVLGIEEVTLITESNLDKFILSPRNSAHDYDLGFQLKYLTKIGKLKKITIIGLPANRNIDYDLIHSILRKLVAQDIQGS
jgi:hypothetical protein